MRSIRSEPAGCWWKPLVIMLVKVVVIFGVALVATMLMIWGERKIVSGMHNRIGPNKAGPFGLLQSLADGIKAFFKETLHPEQVRPVRLQARPVPDVRAGVPRCGR